MLRPRHLLLAAAVLALLPGQAQAEVKSYTLDVINVLNNTTLTITGETSATLRFAGNVEINDESNASPTLTDFTLVRDSVLTTRPDVFAGPNSYIYVRLLSSNTPAEATGTGDTEGFVKWDPLSSWTPLGGLYCKASNEIGNPLGAGICELLSFVQEGTQAATIPSPTYDFPLWTFDAQGDFSSDSYIFVIQSGEASNQEYFARGKLRINIPAMSIVGFGILAGGLSFLGVHALKRRRQR